ncbi:MAG TPA: chitobiase/beta-hexosaminidase C-terminal domain-containing protein, partial [Candidatus Cloacimonadota bacterium]|nr:chitobiase/beta-hexosaminidase C-terminal domain-containing protein [Candidatus Cloacimonadota bacterium]
MSKMRLVLIFVVTVMLIMVAASCQEKTTEPNEETVANPTFSPPEGAYTSAQNVTISCSTHGATIYYSTDGSTPSTQYTVPVNIASTATLKAKATKSGWTD